MPRPKTREGNSEQFCVRVSLDLLEEIDAARGELSRPDWGRDAFLAALGHAAAKSRTGGCPHRLPAGAYCKTCGAE